jgi:DeoR family glycerol-3-phosphate regulon repressor
VELHEIAAVFGIPANRHTVVLLDDQFGADNAETLGPMTIRQVQDFHADDTLISPAAIDSATGMSDADLGEASIARTMLG